MKYILITGGVISGIGKGVIASSIGTILKCCDVHVTAIKIDPYINIDAGTFSPYEHGEVYVLDDGGEVDLDLGNYERFLDVTLHSDNNITTGKIYQHVISKERKGDYLGKTVQVVPHITDAIQDWVEKEAQRPVTTDNVEPEVCIIELGGTIGDIEGMPFVEAFRQFQFKVGRENFFVVHVSLVPQPRSTGEQKTKPTQASVRELRGLGLSPDVVVCRSENPIGAEVIGKISNFCHVAPHQVVSIHDCNSIYRVPLLLEQQGLLKVISERLMLPQTMPDKTSPVFMEKWKALAERFEDLSVTCTVALVGKYTRFEDSYASVTKALQHAALAVGRKLVLKYIDAEDLEQNRHSDNPVKYHDAWKELCGADCILVPGGFGSRGVEGKILAAEWCRLNQKPYLGVCLGMQVAVLEFARNVLHLENASSAEMEPDCEKPLIIEMPEHNPGRLGGTMRLGRRVTLFQGDSTLKRLYGVTDQIEERHRHRYEVNPEYVPDLQAMGLRFVGVDETGQRMEAMELDNHPFYVGVQFHPEYLSRPLRPSPPYVGLLLAASSQLELYLNKNNLKV